MALKTNEKDPDNRGRESREFELRTIWLGIKNDYRTLVGLDSLSLIEKEDTQDEDVNDV